MRYQVFSLVGQCCRAFNTQATREVLPVQASLTSTASLRYMTRFAQTTPKIMRVVLSTYANNENRTVKSKEHV